MKSAFAVIALLVASVIATPIEPTNEVALVKRKSAKRGAAYNAANAINPLAGA
jgi:hypothetical protein